MSTTTTIFEISEVASQCGINQEVILQFISDDWIQPTDPIKMLLDEEDIARIQLISELKEHLGVNDESIPVILHLVDQLHHLHHNLTERNNSNSTN